MNYWQIASGSFGREYSPIFLKYGIAAVGGELQIARMQQVKPGDRVILKRGRQEILAVGGKGLGGSKDRGGTRNGRGHGILPGTVNNDRIPSSPLPSPLQELRPVVHAARWPFGLDGEARTFVCLPGTITGTPAFGVVVGKQDQRLDI